MREAIEDTRPRLGFAKEAKEATGRNHRGGYTSGLSREAIHAAAAVSGGIGTDTDSTDSGTDSGSWGSSSSHGGGTTPVDSTTQPSEDEVGQRMG